MKKLWAPWRMEYILESKKSGCIFCKTLKEKQDERNLIVYRSSHSFVMLNKYPYNNGHLMIAPFRHISEIEKLNEKERLDIFNLVEKSVKALKRAMSPEGFNIGANFGDIAGAGVKDHLHIHIVPRWKGDTNFMPILADTAVLPQALSETYKKLKYEF